MSTEQKEPEQQELQPLQEQQHVHLFISKDKNLPNPPNISSFSIPQLVYAFNELKEKNPNFINDPQINLIKEIVGEMLEKFASSSLVNIQSLEEVTFLSVMKNEEIITKLLEALLNKFESSSLFDKNLLMSLSKVVYFGRRCLKRDHIVKTLSSICCRLEKCSSIDDESLINSMESLTTLFDAIIDLHLHIDKSIISPVYDAIDKIQKLVPEPSSSNGKKPTLQIIRDQLKYSKQALLRIVIQKTDVTKALEFGLRIAEGVVSVVGSILDKDVLKTIQDVIDLYEDGNKLIDEFHEQPEEWFGHVNVLKMASIQNFKFFRNYYHQLFQPAANTSQSRSIFNNNSSTTLHKDEKLKVLLTIIDLLNKIICDNDIQGTIDIGDASRQIREVAMEELCSIYIDTEIYGEDLEVRSLIVDHLWQYCSIPEEYLQIVAKNCLLGIVAFIKDDDKKEGKGTYSLRFLSFNRSNETNNRHPREVWLNETSVMTRGVEPKFNYSHSFLSTLSTSASASSLIQEAMEEKCSDVYIIEAARQRAFDLHNSEKSTLKSDLSTYIPLNCSSGPRNHEELSLEDKIKYFLPIDCQQKVLLLHGLAGSGKTLFGRWLEAHVWNLFVPRDDESMIPIFVTLTSLKDPTRTLIEESLTSYGFNQKQINKLRSPNSTQRFLFILDGYDEIHCKIDLYESNKFNEFNNAKVIITSKSEYLFGLGNYLSHFGSSSNLQELYICPFNEVQRNLFFCKVPSTTYQQWFNNAEELKKLVTTPYLLRIITEILPSLVGEDEKSDNKLNPTRALIYQIFTDREFLNQKEKMRKDPGIILPKIFNEVESFLKFSMHLAVLMFIHRQTTVEIRGSDYRLDDEKEDTIWEKLLSNPDPAYELSRYGAPLNFEGRQISFRDKSLQEYFAARMLLRELSLLKENQEMAEDNYFNGRYLFEEPSVRDFLKEMMHPSSSFSKKYDCNWKKILLRIIESSKTNESISVACGNSITLLVLLGHSFAESDLKQIHCSGAVFDNGNFQQADFEGSVFKDCSWNGCNLNSCNFTNCDFTNSNLIEERSSLYDSPSPITDLLNLNKSDIILSSHDHGVSIWKDGSFVKRFKNFKKSHLFCSPNEQWIFVSSPTERKGYLFRSNDFTTICYTINNLVCGQDAISLTDNELVYGVQQKGCIRLIRMPLNLEIDNSQFNDRNKIVVNDTATQLMGVQSSLVSNNHYLFVYHNDLSSKDTFTIYHCPSGQTTYESTSIELTLAQFKLIPNTLFVFYWTSDHTTYLLHMKSSSPSSSLTTTTTIEVFKTKIPQSIKCQDCCISPDGSSMLLGSSTEGYLFSISDNQITTNINSISSSSIATMVSTTSTSTTAPTTKSPLTFNLLPVSGMTGRFSPSQYSSDGQFVSLIYGAEIRVMKVIDCAVMQVVQFHSPLDRVLFNESDKELLVVERGSNTIIRRKVDLKEDISISSSPSSLSCAGSFFIGATGLTSEDIPLFKERGGLFKSQEELMNEYESCTDQEKKRDILKECLRSQFIGEYLIQELLKMDKADSGINVMHEVVSMEYFDGSYANYFVYLNVNKISCERKDENGDTLLSALSRKGHIKTINTLFDQCKWHKMINEINNKGESALWIAANNGSELVCKFLLSKGAGVNQVNHEQLSPLYTACQLGHKWVCLILLEANANVNQLGFEGATPLFIASKNGHASICELLLKFGANAKECNKFGMSPLFVAAKFGHKEICSLLLKHDEETCGSMITHCDSTGATPLYAAAENGHWEICGMLLQKYKENIDQPTKKKETPLLDEPNNEEKIPLNGEETPLFAASSQGHLLACGVLLEFEADVNKANSAGVTPLIIAVSKNHKAVCKLLLDKGANVNQANDDGHSPLFVAAVCGFESICKLLLDYGAIIGEDSVDIAWANGNHSISKLLKERKSRSRS